MHEKNEDEKGRPNTAERGPETETPSAASHPDPEQDLVYRLKTAIDQRGRYAFRLDDMTAGFAAGRKTSINQARKTIEDRFTAEFGQSPHG